MLKTIRAEINIYKIFNIKNGLSTYEIVNLLLNYPVLI